MPRLSVESSFVERQGFFPLGVVFFEQVFGPVAIPGVAVAAFVAELGVGFEGDAVAIAEEWLLGLEVVEAGPEARGFAVLDDGAVFFAIFVFDFLDANVVERVICEPSNGGLDGADDFGRWLIDAHQKAGDADGLGAAEGGEFVGAGECGLEVDFIVLSAPDGGFAIDDDLAAEDALDALIEGATGLLALLVGEELVLRVRLRICDLAKEFEESDHGAVVEGNVAVVFVAGRMELGPAAIAVLGAVDVVEPADKGFFVGGRSLGLVETGEEAEFIGGGAVVEGWVDFFGIAGVGFAGSVGVFGPSAAWALVGENDGGGLGGGFAFEPRIGLLEEISDFVFFREQRSC